jgi:hypothetical protein
MAKEQEQYEALTQEELEALEGEALPRREALSVIGPLPAAPTDAAATDLPEIVDAPE